MNRPNIIYMHSHDTGRYLQPYGHAIPTPRLQQLAEDGVLFRQAFCAAPTCSPSRAALLTGQSAHASGMLGLAHRGFRLNDYSQHLVHTLRAAGYYSALAGLQHVAGDAQTIGYDEILSPKNEKAEVLAQTAVAFLQQKHEQLFFLDVGFFETHRKFPPVGPDDDPRYCLPPAPLPDTPEVRADMAAYKTSARRLDAGVGAILDALDAAGLAENTLVISTTDHGIAFPGMKCNLTDHGIGVSLIVRGPGGFRGGKVVDGMVSHIDVFPTICELLEIERPAWLTGKSVLPLVNDGAAQINDAVFAEVSFHVPYEPMRAVRTARWKYIRRWDDRHRVVLPNCDASPSKDVWMENGWREQFIANEQLFDLVFDPNETSNLAGDDKHAETLSQLRQRLDQWMQETNDPLLKGPLREPSGAPIGDPDEVSPDHPQPLAP